MWAEYFKLNGIVPGRVVIPGYGMIDFSRKDLPVDLVKELYENDYHYLEITPKGKRELYGIGPPAVIREPGKRNAFPIEDDDSLDF